MPPAVKPLASLSANKVAKVEEFRLLRKLRVITKDEYEAEVRKLNARQMKEDAKREAKEAEREKAKKIAELAKEKEREEKRKAKQMEINRLRKQKRAERKAEASKKNITVTYHYTYHFKHDKPGSVRHYNGEFSEIVPATTTVDDFVQNWIDEHTEQIDEQSQIIRDTDINWAVGSVVNVTPQATNKRVILMKAVYALGLDGEVAQTWDSGKGKCVYDFLIWRYGDMKGCKKVCNYQSLDILFKGRSEHDKRWYQCPSNKCVIFNEFLLQCDDCKECNSKSAMKDETKWYYQDDRMFYMFDNDLNPYADQNPQEDGVNSHQLEFFCDAVGCHMYALDEREKLIKHHIPLRINPNLPPLIYRIKDNHIYPIMNRNKSIAEKSKRKTEMSYIKKVTKDDEEGDNEPDPVNVSIVKPGEDKTHTQVMVDIMKEQKKQVYPFNNIHMSGDSLQGFQLGNVKYMFDEDAMVEVAVEIAKLNNEPYTGDSVYGILYKLMEEQEYNDKSILNPVVFDVLTATGIKYRTHYGVCDEDIKRRIKDGEDTTSLLEEVKMEVEQGYSHCVDIAKCHTSIYQKPMDNWLLFDFNDEFKPFNIRTAWHQGNFKPGLYYVTTDDMTLLHGNNIYSHTILNKAKDEGIIFNPNTMMLPSRKSKPLDYFKKLLDAIRQKCKGESKYMKVLTNIITGMLGKDSSKRTVAKLNTDINTVWDDFSDLAFNNNKPFMYQVDEFFLYGYSVKTTMVENNIPMYIQVLDQANIRLYNLIKDSKCVPLWRKTDCVILRGELGVPIVPEDKTAVPGQYRKSELPNLYKAEAGLEHRNVMLNTMSDPWRHHGEITSSSQVDEVYSLLRKYRGVCNVSRAGTGKSYNILKLEEKFKTEFPEAYIKKIAFTNKACLNIGGTTIHKFLKIDKSGKFNVDWLRSLSNKQVLIMIDEVSMIGAYLWRRLVELKKAVPTAHFLLAGDYRQVPPVEEGNEDYDYFECPAMKYMANYTRIEFVERQRYDEALWNFAEQVWEQDTTNLSMVKAVPAVKANSKFLAGKSAICYFNTTRVMVNKMMNDYFADKDDDLVIVFPFKPEEADAGKKTLQQDVKLYKGLPVIAHHNEKAKDSDELRWANNECFTVTELDESGMKLVSQRPNEDGDMEDHEVEIVTKEFHKHFLLNYCSTTHKSQGATIDNDIVVYDYDAMTKNIKYTAITRCKKISQIHIVV
jgi:hypothetical protein